LYSGNNEKKSEKYISQGILLGIKLTYEPMMGVDVSRDDQIKDACSKREELVKGIELIPNILRLRTIRKEDLERFRSQKLVIEFFKTEFGQTLIEWIHHDPYEINKIYNIIEKTLLALRLLQPGNVFLSHIFSYTNDFVFKELLNYRSPPKFYTYYSLDINQKGTLKDIFNNLLSVEFEKDIPFRISCDRFNSSYYDVLSEDRLIDLCIAFEALFLKGEYKQSDLGMGQVIGLACSMLLGEKKKKRKKISNVLREGFSLRNRVVHGRNFKRSQISEILPDFEDYLRKSILRLIP